MNFSQFNKRLQDMATHGKDVTGVHLSQKVAATALRFIDDNFRSSSWEGKPWEQSSEDGTPLIHTGALRRSFNQDSTPHQVRIYTNVKYARVHNEGFSGIENVSAHTRGIYKKQPRGRKQRTGSIQVRSFTRQQHIKQRQFAPYEGHESPTLAKLIEHTITEHAKTILHT